MRKRRQRNPPEPTTPTLRFSPTAWGKLLFLRDLGDTEVGGFGISRADDLLLVEDVQLVKQHCGWAHVAFADESVADFFDMQVDAGRQPEQFARIWVHTHPGDSPLPSQTDEETFDRVFGTATWAIMFILACGGTSYARLKFNVGPTGEIEIPVQIDYRHPFQGCNREAWSEEYQNNVQSDETIVNSPLEMGLLDNWAEPPLHTRINIPAYKGDEFDDFRYDGDWSL